MSDIKELLELCRENETYLANSGFQLISHIEKLEQENAELKADLHHLRRELAEERSGDCDLIKERDRAKRNVEILEKENTELKEKLTMVCFITEKERCEAIEDAKQFLKELDVTLAELGE